MPEKTKRTPSKWNLYLGECSKELTDLPFGERAGICSTQYQEIKDDLEIGEDGTLINTKNNKTSQ